MDRIFLALLHYGQLFWLLYGLFELIIAAADLKIYVGELIFDGIEDFHIHLERFLQIDDDLINGHLGLDFGGTLLTA